jgi:hypothetical protein
MLVTLLGIVMLVTAVFPQPKTGVEPKKPKPSAK